MYSNTDIITAMDHGDIIIKPFNTDQLGTNSYDVCLGNTFFLVQWDNKGPYFVGPYVYLDGEKVNIPVGGTLLGVTKEIIGAKGKVVAELRSRSTTRRIGITTNCDAGLGDVNYCDFWTIELTAFINKSKYNMIPVTDTRPFLIVGQPIAQMVFYKCLSRPYRTYEGQYTSEWPLNMIPAQYRDRVVNP